MSQKTVKESVNYQDRVKYPPSLRELRAEKSENSAKRKEKIKSKFDKNLTNYGRVVNIK